MSSSHGSIDDSVTVILGVMGFAVVLLVAMVLLVGVGRQSDDLGDSSDNTGLTCQRYGEC